MSDVRVTTVGDLREAMAGLTDSTPISFGYEGPEECCEGHVHDVRDVSGCYGFVTAIGTSVACITLTDGSV